jgi:hypothetical protein
METCPTCGAPAERNYPMGIGNPQDGYTYQPPNNKGNASAEEAAVEVFEWLTGNNANEYPKTIDAIQRRFTISKKQ